MVGYGIEGALKFGFYEFFKPVFGNLTPNAFLNFLLASVVAGAVASVVLCPCEDARIRMVSEPHFATGLVDALVKLIKEDGVLATFDGLAAMLTKQVPYTMTKQVILTQTFYSTLCDFYHKRPRFCFLCCAKLSCMHVIILVFFS